ncbi:MAG TPA: NADH-quinone oxidoreductase subunit J [Verrucomicrobiae bacterium]|jgi:NADH-quinone oxidoreductase subunit J|nr:NADH-quinone oxidoreductase subunit J [Verrucomicrobiae bacterium]
MTALWWLIAIVLIATAVWTISASKPVYSVVALLAHFLALAVSYIMLSAEFLGVIQIVIYVGAILVLFVFVIALLSSGVASFSVGPNRMKKGVWPAGIAVAVAFGLMTWKLAGVVASPKVGGSLSTVPGTAGAFGSVADFGKALFTTYLLPFEITAFVLMVAVIGVILLAGDRSVHDPSPKRAALVRREMREAILRGGEE